MPGHALRNTASNSFILHFSSGGRIPAPPFTIEYNTSMQNVNLIKIACTVLCLPGIVTIASAQFAGPHLLPPGNGLEQTLIFYRHADLDADGYEDLITAKRTKRPGTGYYYYAVDWHRNDNVGGYEAPRLLNSINDFHNGLYEIISTDIDGDGLEDLVYAGDGVAWQPNNGGGNFGQLTIALPAGDNFILDKVGDVDEDGDPDLVGHNDTSVQWSANDGAGNFQDAETIIQQACCLYLVRVADLNGDERLDIVVSGIEPNWLRWYPNLGGGVFGAAVGIQSDISESGIDIQLADLDGDGDTDVIGAIQIPYPQLSYAKLLWWPNDGAGNFPEFIPIFIPSISSGISHPITITDVNGDDAPDILGLAMIYQGNYWSGHLTAWTNQNNGSGEFIQSEITTVETPFFGPQATDLDADGFSDATFQIASSIYVFRSDGNGTFESRRRVHHTLTDVESFQLTDLNGDAKPDVIYTQNGYDGILGWRAGDGDGNFGAFQSLTPDYDTLQSTLVGDLDNDGDQDLVVHRVNSDWYTYIRWNDGAGNFSPETLLSSVFEVRYLLDMDGDQDIDLVGWNHFSQLAGWFVNDGTGNFSYFFWDPFEYQMLGFGDFDADGDQDMVSVDPVTGYLYLQFNLGNGEIAGKEYIGTIGVNNFPTTIPSDMDSDGDLDILIVDQYNNMQWLVNLNNGFLFDNSPRLIATNTTGRVRTVVADFDQDGDNDIVTASEVDSLFNAPGQFAWYENLGGGEFAAAHYFGEAADCLGLQATDLDGDGDLELAWHSAYAVGWWDNLGNEPFISGICFWDKNENKIRDPGEPPAAGISLSLQPASLRTFVASNGAFKFFVSSGDYTLSYLANSCWERTTDSAEYHLTYADTTLSGYQFGFKPTNDNRYVRPIVTGGHPRCDSEVPFWISLVNRSCNEAAGRVALVLDDMVSFISSQPIPTATTGDTLWWNFDTIQPFALRKIKLVLKINGSAGDTIHLRAFTWLDEPDGSYTFSDATAYLTEIRCSFDPNDKMVDRPTVPKDYSPEGHELIYTIRFQNTGNDTAFLVRLRDILSADLDWTTLRPLGSSHPYYVVLNSETGLLQFTFDDIALPDSTTNFTESQGFVQFAIQLQPGLPPGTVVPNRAGIYFDANPVVPTNTAETLVLASVATHIPAGPQVLFVQPNPTTGICTLRLTRPARQDALLELMDMQGSVLYRSTIPRGTQERDIDLEDMPAGLYLVKMTTAGQVTATAKIIRQ
ncbi:MAG: hypothetical protein EPGJADBJ_03906 [Saprospiraceae bacterium]|nr:hypothetical protein [Saprospiraceae bacterium]